jgi:hypothetical protein
VVQNAPESEKPGADAPSRSLEETLAIIDGRSNDELAVNRYRSLLQQLDVRFVESRQQIGDITAKAHEVLRDEGVAASLLDIMEGINRAAPSGSANERYSDYVALYISLRQKGQSHAEAVAILPELVQSLRR